MVEASPVTAAAPAADEADDESRVSTLELFFDLVFVFAFTQVTATLAKHPTGAGLGRAALVLLVLWWAWAAYAWLTNTVATDRLAPRTTLMVAMAAMMVVALAVPEAFESTAGALAFALAYLAVRVTHLVLYAVAGGEFNRRGIIKLVPSTLVAAALLLVSVPLVADRPGWAAVLWLLAVVFDYGGPLVTGVGNFQVAPRHFAERHGLIVIIALGESVVAIGVGAVGHVPSGWLLVAALASMVLISALWWAYFDREAAAIEHAMLTAPGPARSYLARDIFSYLHVVLVAGIVFIAVGIKFSLAHPTEALKWVPAVALCGGGALYLAALIGIRMRRGAAMGTVRPLGALVCLGMVPVSLTAPSLLSVAAIGYVLLTVALADRRRPRLRPSPLS